MKNQFFLFIFRVSSAVFLLTPSANASDICESRESFQLLRCVKSLAESAHWMSAVEALEDLRFAEEVSEVRSALTSCEQAQNWQSGENEEAEGSIQAWLENHPFATQIQTVLDTFVTPVKDCSEFSVGMPIGIGLIGHSRSGVRHCTSTRFDQWLEQVREASVGIGIAVAPYASNETLVKGSTYINQELFLNYKLYEYVLNAKSGSSDLTEEDFLESALSNDSHFERSVARSRSVEVSIPIFPLRASRKQATHTCRYLREELVAWPEFSNINPL